MTLQTMLRLVPLAVLASLHACVLTPTAADDTMRIDATLDGTTYDTRDPQFCLGSPPAGEGQRCSASEPCPEYLRCVYEPGCVDPHGSCHRWAFCPDVAIQQHGCSCNHEPVTTQDEPLEEWGDGCAPTDAAGE
jgi:hypothetical protein